MTIPCSLAVADPDIPDTRLNQVQPMFPTGYVPGQLAGVTLRSSRIFQAWAEATGDSRGRITATEVPKHTGTTYTLRWSPKEPLAEAGQDPPGVT